MISLRKRIFWASLHSIWMIILVFAWMKQPVTWNYEFTTTKELLYISNGLKPKKTKLLKKYAREFLFINTAYSLKSYDEAPDYWGSNVITDRNQLTELMYLLLENQSHFKIAFLDVYLDRLIEGEQDQNLQKSVEKLKANHKLVTVNHVEQYYQKSRSSFRQKVHKNFPDSLVLRPNILGEILSAPTFYRPSVQNTFYRFEFQLKKGTLKQAPLLVYEIDQGITAKKPFLFNLFYKYDGKSGIHQNLYIPNMVLPSTLPETVMSLDSHGEKMEKLVKFDLNNLHSWGDYGKEILRDNLETFPNQILIIGDLGYMDRHATLKGVQNGSIIFSNLLIDLKEGANKLRGIYLVFLFISFFMVSYLTFYPNRLTELQQIEINIWGLNFLYHYFLRRLNYILLFFTVLLGLFWFNTYLFFFFNLIYIYILSQLIDYRKYKRRRK